MIRSNSYFFVISDPLIFADISQRVIMDIASVPSLLTSTVGDAIVNKKTQKTRK